MDSVVYNIIFVFLFLAILWQQYLIKKMDDNMRMVINYLSQQDYLSLDRQNSKRDSEIIEIRKELANIQALISNLDYS